MLQKQKILLLDSNAIIHRAFHALPPLSTKSGILINAVYGYALALLAVLEKFQPVGVVATFDLRGPTFRHKQYEKYKATRKKAPDELYNQIPLVKDLLQAFGILILEKSGFEADDLIGTLVRLPELADYEKVIITGDLDALQLVNDTTKVYVFRKGIKEALLYDEKVVKERFNLTPEQLKSFKGLRGDASDNIPGVKGIGEKTAIDLIGKYGDLKGVYAHLAQINSLVIKKKLEEGRESAFLSYDLGSIKTDVSLENFSLEKCWFSLDKKRKNILRFFSQMEFYSLVKRLSGQGKATNKKERKSQVKIIKTDNEERELLERIEKKKIIFLAPFSENLTSSGWGISIDGYLGYFLPRSRAEKLWSFFSREDILKVSYDFKEIMVFGGEKKKIGFSAWRGFWDLKIIFYLLRPEAGNDWDSLRAVELGEEIEKKKKVGQASLFFSGENNFSEKDFLMEARKSLTVFKLYQLSLEKVKKINWDEKWQGNFFSTQELFKQVELPLVPILAQMEKNGFKVNRQQLERTGILAQTKLEILEKEIFDLVGENFNINSPSQLAEILFGKLKLPVAGIKKGKTGFSTDAEQLAKLRKIHPVIEKIEKFREIAKLKNTYADALLEMIKKDGRIHAHFNQALTATGRLSCDRPNLQNIPKKGELAKEIRKAFIAEEDKVLLSVDYSQIDLRVAAHLSGDGKMKEVFLSGKDIHRITAAWVNGIGENEVTAKQRDEAKALNFGVLYGMGIYGFMRDSGVSRKRAEFFIAEYMNKFSGLKKYLDWVKEEARRKGYLETQLGRRRYISGFDQSFGGAERMAINFPIQGLAADIMKLAMVKIFSDFPVLWEAKEICLILQVHDELIFEVEKELADTWAKKIKKSMEEAFPLTVPLIAETKVGNTWAEL